MTAHNDKVEAVARAIAEAPCQVWQTLPLGYTYMTQAKAVLKLMEEKGWLKAEGAREERQRCIDELIERADRALDPENRCVGDGSAIFAGRTAEANYFRRAASVLREKDEVVTSDMSTSSSVQVRNVLRYVRGVIKRYGFQDPAIIDPDYWAEFDAGGRDFGLIDIDDWLSDLIDTFDGASQGEEIKQNGG